MNYSVNLSKISEVIQEVRELSQKVHGDPDLVQILPATKYLPAPQLLPLLEIGLNQFGENRVQDHLAKLNWLSENSSLPFSFHFIGNLQSNKIKKMWGKMELFHGFDRMELIPHFEKEFENSLTPKPQPILLEIKWEGEDSKHGFSLEDIFKQSELIGSYKSIHLQGLMIMAPHSDNQKDLERCFRETRKVFDRLNQERDPRDPMRVLSMGMSQDYPIAIQEGSTMVRLGRVLYDRI